MSRIGPFCTHCGTQCVVSFEPAGFDHFWGWKVYLQRERCPNAVGWFNGHTNRLDRWPEKAEFYGFTDESIPLARP